MVRAGGIRIAGRGLAPPRSTLWRVAGRARATGGVGSDCRRGDGGWGRQAGTDGAALAGAWGAGVGTSGGMMATSVAARRWLWGPGISDGGTGSPSMWTRGTWCEWSSAICSRGRFRTAVPSSSAAAGSAGLAGKPSSVSVIGGTSPNPSSCDNRSSSSWRSCRLASSPPARVERAIEGVDTVVDTLLLLVCEGEAPDHDSSSSAGLASATWLPSAGDGAAALAAAAALSFRVHWAWLLRNSSDRAAQLVLSRDTGRAFGFWPRRNSSEVAAQ